MKKIVALALLIALMLTLAACGKAKNETITFELEDGKQVVVTLDTSDGYSMEKVYSSLFIYHGDSFIIGELIDYNMYMSYYSLNEDLESFELLDNGFQYAKDYDGVSEYARYVLIDDEVGYCLFSIHAMEPVVEADAHLSFEVAPAA